MLTSGQAHDLAGAGSLLDDVEPQALIGDKAYDADVLIETLVRRHVTSVIPSKANRKIPRPCDFALYAERNRRASLSYRVATALKCLSLLKKRARNFLAGVQLASAMILLN